MEKPYAPRTRTYLPAAPGHGSGHARTRAETRRNAVDDAYEFILDSYDRTPAQPLRRASAPSG
ncbi:hypothetical protein ABZW32_16465 [Streptomyces sp. NPDC004667]|uniref:hypothetical protein n=1 Tax=Streptomyces sp. NPDC004667 TaxID=3154285 RepID=UPI0033B0F808